MGLALMCNNRPKEFVKTVKKILEVSWHRKLLQLRHRRQGWINLFLIRCRMNCDVLGILIGGFLLITKLIISGELVFHVVLHNSVYTVRSFYVPTIFVLLHEKSSNRSILFENCTFCRKTVCIDLFISSVVVEKIWYLTQGQSY